MLNLAMTVALTSGAFAQPEALTGLAPAIAGVSESKIDGPWLEIRTTAYTHSESDHLVWGRKTALGSTLRYGKVRSAAADWSKFPVGTQFRIEGETHLYEIDEYGSALVGRDTIDLYRPTRSAMNRWGAREIQIRIVRWGCFERSYEIMRDRTHNKAVRRMVQAIERRL